MKVLNSPLRLVVLLGSYCLFSQQSGAVSYSFDEPVVCAGESGAELFIEPLTKLIDPEGGGSGIVVDYPFEHSVFPPEMVAPTFLWHDSNAQADLWLVRVSFKVREDEIFVLTEGRQAEPDIDQRAVSSANKDYKRSVYDLGAKSWKPEDKLWERMKELSLSSSAVVHFYGFDSRDLSQILSAGQVSLTTSENPVGAPIFYRDVPLMPSTGSGGVIKPIAEDALDLISWRLRDISKPKAPVLLSEMPTCANCHSFSSDGKTLGMDMDGPDGDKGAYALDSVEREMVIKHEDIITWNSFSGTPKGHKNFGLFSQVSPDGRYVVSTLNESTFVVNYSDFKFLQSFYPTRGILVVYDRETGEMKPLPGASSIKFVQTNACWSPDGERLIFSRAVAKDRYTGNERPTFAGDKRETFIQYDLYSIPFNGGAGGVAEPLRGASGNGMSNSFPKISPDGKWVVFVQSKKGQLIRPDSRLFIMPVEGGEAREMNCNLDLMNSWHSWSPNSRWLVFSSKGFTPFTQMFLTHIDEQGIDTPAILIPDSTAANRAVNIPEFLNGAGDVIACISAPTQMSYRHYKDGLKLAKSGDYKAALKEFDRSIELNPYYDAVYNDKGYTFFRMGKTEEALKFFYKGVELEPRNETAHNNVCMVLEQSGRLDELEDYCRSVLAARPGMISVRRRLADLCLSQEDYSGGAENYRALVESNPEDIDAINRLAVCLLELRRYADAIIQYETLLKLQPNNIAAVNGLAWTLAVDADGKERQRAVKLALKAARLCQYRSAAVLDTLAIAYAANGEYAEAIRQGEKALSLSKDSSLTAEITSRLKLYRQSQPYVH